MDDFNLNSRYKRYRKRRDEYRNTILEFIVRENWAEKRTHFLNFPNTRPNENFDFKKEANRLVRRLAAQGVFHSFSIREQKNAELNGKLPRDYHVDFIIPPAVGGSYSFDNLYVVPKEVSSLMYQMYWKQVIPEAKSFVGRGETHRFGVQFPDIPKFFSRKDFLDFIPSYEKQDLIKYFMRKEKWRKDALRYVVAKKSKRTLILSLQKRKKAPAGMKYALLKTTALSSLERAKVKQEYLHQRASLVRASFERGDFIHLSDKMKATILHTGHVPTGADLTCHHILPRSLGGENVLENICWLGKNDHLRLHRTYIDPLIEYMDGVFDEPRTVFVEIPVPVDTKMPLFTISRQGLVVEDKPKSSILRKVFKRAKAHKMR